MNKLFFVLKQFCIILLIVSIIGGLVFIPAPKKAEAVTANLAGCVATILATFGLTNIGGKIVDEVSGVVSTAVPVRDASVISNTRFVVDKSTQMNPYVKCLVQTVVHEMTTSIINWINNGFEGSPTFISNPEGFFGDIGDQILGTFIEGAGLDFLCTPFKLDIQLQLRQVYRKDYRVYCTPTRIAQVQGFVSKDFSEVGWDGWLSLTNNDQNNVYGSWVQSNNDLNAAVNHRINSALNELTWGNGFLSIKDKDGNITTPGSVIVGQADQVLGSNLRELELAKEFDDIIYALINQLTSQLLTKGLNSH